MGQAGPGTPGFNAAAAEGMWLHYLGEDYDREKTSRPTRRPLAPTTSERPAAGLRPDQRPRPPARRGHRVRHSKLLAAGIEVELYNCPGAYHGADPLDPRTAGVAFTVYNAALGAALNPDAPTSGF